MKKYIITALLSAIVFGLFSCKEEKEEEKEKEKSPSPYIKILSVSSTTVLAGDTLVVQYEANNLEDPSKITVKISDIQVTPIEITLNELKIVVPLISSGIEGKDVLLVITRPETTQEAFRLLMYTIIARITSVYPFEGKGGDILTVTGRGFTELDSCVFYIHLLPCKILELSNNKATIVVPEGCGSGTIKVYLSEKKVNNKSKSYETTEVFQYKFDQFSSLKLVGLNSYTYILDEKGRIKEQLDVNNKLYWSFIYDTEGLIDKIYHYDYRDGLPYVRSYYAYTRAPSLIVVGYYIRVENQPDVLSMKDEYHYNSDGKLEKLVRENIAFSEGSISECTYKNDKCYVNRTTYNIDNGVTKDERHYTYVFTYDMYNKPFRLPVPGLPIDHDRNVIMMQQGRNEDISWTNKLIYNSAGDLMNLDNYSYHISTVYTDNMKFVYQ